MSFWGNISAVGDDSARKPNETKPHTSNLTYLEKHQNKEAVMWKHLTCYLALVGSADLFLNQLEATRQLSYSAKLINAQFVLPVGSPSNHQQQYNYMFVVFCLANHRGTCRTVNLKTKSQSTYRRFTHTWGGFSKTLDGPGWGSLNCECRSLLN